jgi:uncharacterized protein
MSRLVAARRHKPGHGSQTRVRVILGAALFLAAPGVAQANCSGHDLFPELQAQAPASYAAIVGSTSAMPFPRGKLFRLSRAGSPPSYVFATLHLSDPRIVNFPSRLRTVIAESKVVALETIETGAVLQQAIANDGTAWRRATLAHKDERADRLLDGADFAELEALVARKSFKASGARELKPSALALLLDLPSCATSKGVGAPYVDELVAQIAREDHIPIVGLETLIEQLEILDGLPRETERDLLVAVLRQARRGEDGVETTIARYAQGDIGGLLAWMRSPEPFPGVAKAQIPPAFLERLIETRNRRMRDRALPLLERGGAFIAVGAAHLPGKDGLLALFERDGYAAETIE